MAPASRNSTPCVAPDPWPPSPTWARQAQRTGAGNDQHRHCVDQPKTQLGSGPNSPQTRNVATAIEPPRPQTFRPPHRPYAAWAPSSAAHWRPSERSETAWWPRRLLGAHHRRHQCSAWRRSPCRLCG
jgi:hypothetical protein